MGSAAQHSGAPDRSPEPGNLHVTDVLAAVLPDVQIQELEGQAHEGMTTAPEMYAAAVSRFLLA